MDPISYWVLGILGVDSLQYRSEVGRRSTCVIGVVAIDGARSSSSSPDLPTFCTTVWSHT
eukprot:scaffold18193_cov54-Phaeocystis_antarctica.AAC.1